ncbi:MAG: hypothetical protein HY859_01995 [Caulobacterales bacterium]|nr:hypothetical protein [Caulobacterales bacterium]
MPHREKIAWLLLVAMLACYVPYFTVAHFNPPPADLLPNLTQIRLLALVAIAHALIQGLGRLWFRIRSPEDARAPADERDRAIERRSTTVAYYVLMTGMILVGVMMPFTENGWTIVNAGLFMIVLAETFHYGIAVWSYRRSAA